MGAPIGAVASGVASAGPPVLTTLVKLGPGIALGRYIGTGKSAREDAMAILNGLNEAYSEIANYAGRVTRSISDKKAQLDGKITAAKQAIAATYVSAGESASSASTGLSSGFAVIKSKICGLVDKIVAGGMVIAEIVGSLNSELGDLSATSSGGKRRTRRMQKKKQKKQKK
jgi:hypothetical protein